MKWSKLSSYVTYNEIVFTFLFQNSIRLLLNRLSFLHLPIYACLFLNDILFILISSKKNVNPPCRVTNAIVTIDICITAHSQRYPSRYYEVDKTQKDFQVQFWAGACLHWFRYGSSPQRFLFSTLNFCLNVYIFALEAGKSQVKHQSSLKLK